MVRAKQWVAVGLCGFFLPASALLVRPVAPTGMNDDWSYFETARQFAQTGHIAYNGWSAPFLGWQLYVADVFIHLLGYSFLSVRLGTLLIATLLAVVLQQMFVSSGLRLRYSVLASLTVISSPVFVPLAFSYMSDIYGLFCFCLCFLLCLRAVQANTDRATLAWFFSAVVLATVTGSARQIAWLGVLVMCPSALFLVRHQRRIVPAAIAVLLAAWGIVSYALFWFARQPYTQAELLPTHITFHMVALIPYLMGGALLECTVLLAPVLLLFLPLADRRRLLQSLVPVALVLVAVVLAGTWLHHAKVYRLLFPNLPNYAGPDGAVVGTYLKGERPIVLVPPVRAIWTFCGIAGAGALLLACRALLTNATQTHARGTAPSWQTLNTLLLPFMTVYSIILVPRAMDGTIFDRYFLILLCFGSLYALRFYQEHAVRHILWPALVLLVPVAAYSIATTHDVFALHRARLAAIARMHDGGLPEDQMDGGFEYNGLREVQLQGFVPAPRMKETRQYTFPPATPTPPPCQPQLAALLPHLHARYGISFQADKCAGPARLPPVYYHAWLGLHTVPLYVIRYGETARLGRH